MGEAGFEPASLAAADFKSAVYSVPPLARGKTACGGYDIINVASLKSDDVRKKWYFGIFHHYPEEIVQTEACSRLCGN